jgi:threonine synthase
MRIICSKCAHEVPMGTFGLCPNCGGILQPQYGEEAIASLKHLQPGRGIDRYRATLPTNAPVPFLGEGDTPLIPSRRIGPALGLQHLYFKNEGLNPSGAFKDRAGAMAAALALEAGAKGIVTASSGNTSSAMAAYCAAVGLPCVILLEPGNPTAKLRQTLATGAKVLLVEGIFAHGPDTLREFILAVAARINYYPAFVWAPVNPYILEGIKTISYEVAAQLPSDGDPTPLNIVAPVGGGDMLAAQWRGWKELYQAGVVANLPRMHGVQSLSAPPLLEAMLTNADHVATLSYANSKISGINVPFTGDHALMAVRESGGGVAGVSDDEILAMQRRIAMEEGLWIEPASAAPVAALENLLDLGAINAEERIVCIMSGAGFKDAKLAADEAQAIGEHGRVAFDVNAVAKALI